VSHVGVLHGRVTTGYGMLGAVPLPVPPKVLRPLIYCAFRPAANEWCTSAASTHIEEMALCHRHATDVERFLAQEDGQNVG